MKNIIKIVKDKYSQLPLGLKASIWYTLCNILIRSLSFITVPVFSRTLSFEEYGRYTLYNSWMQFVSIIATLNLFMGVYLKGLVKFEENKKNFISSMQLLTSVTTLLTIILFLVFGSFFESLTGLDKDFLVLMAIQSLMLSAINFWSTKLRFEYKYKSFVIVTLILGFGTPIINVLAVKFLSQSVTNVVIYSFVIYQVLIGLIFYLRNLKGVQLSNPFIYWKFALSFNLPLIPYYLSQILLDQVPKVMIGNFYGEKEVALYNIPYQLSAVLTVVSQSISNSFIPTLYNNLKAGTESKLKGTQNIILILIGFVCLGINLMAPEVLGLLAPREYSEAVLVIGPVLVGMYFKYIISIFNNIEFYYEKPRISMYLSVFSAIFTIGLNFFLMPIFGYIVAGYTTLISYTLCFILHFIYLSLKKYDKSYDTKSILLISFSVILVVIGSQLLYEYFILRMVLLAIICLIFVVKRNMIIRLIKKEVV